MALEGTWSRVSTASGVSRNLTVGASVPAGKFLAVAVTVNSNVTTITLTDSNGNTYVQPVKGNNATNFTTVLFVTVVASALDATDTMTVTTSTTVNRCALVAGFFGDVDSVVDRTTTPAVAVTSATPVTATYAYAVARALSLSVAGFTGAGNPAVGNSNTLVGTTATTAGSSDRGVALLYTYDTDGTMQGRATLDSSVTSVILGAAFDAVVVAPPPPAGGLGGMVIGGQYVPFVGGGIVVAGEVVPFVGGGIVVAGEVVPFV